MHHLTDNQLLHNLETERDRLRRYQEAADGDPDGYRVREIASDVAEIETEAARRGVA